MTETDALETNGRLFSGEQRSERLFAELRQSDLSRHLALFYQEPETQIEVAAIFICHGLQSGRRCLYLLDTNERWEIEAALEETGIDVQQRIEAGDLEISDASSVYLESGFEPDRMISTLEAAVEGSLEDGYEGLCVAGENTWCFHTEIPFDHVLDFEIDFDATCPDYPVSALCQYDLDQFCQESAAKALWTHEQIVYRYTVCENPYYIPPEEYRSRDETTLNPALMLEQTYELAQSRRRLQRREQRLEVISRILRHNIRNDLNVVTGNIELLQESDRLSEQDRQRLDTALQHVAGVCEIADQSQYVQDTLDRRHITDLALDSLLERVLDRIGDVYPGATVEIDGREGITVLADANLGDALFELFATVLGCQESDPPTASVSYEPTAPGTLRMHVEAPDPLMPASDRHALRRGTETQLEHGTGLGLWLVKWIVENGYGSLSFPQAETSLEIELRRIPE